MGADAPEELTEVAAAGGAFGITGILLLVVAVAYLIVGVGVLQRKQWSRMGTVIVNGLYVVIALLGMILAGGFNVITLVLVVISAAIAFLFYTNGDIKATLTN
jgi:4-hydroxybenzoate polyprenyltransferase